MHLPAYGLYLALGLLAFGQPAWAKDPDRQARQSQVEQEQVALRERLQSLQKQIDEREAARQEATDALKVTETAISAINRKVSAFNAQTAQAQTELDALQVNIKRQKGSMAQRREELALQLRKQYQSGLSPWSALLSGDHPDKLGRNLAYLDYVSRARAEAVTALKQAIDVLAQLESQADARKQEMVRLARETTEQKNALQAQKTQRSTILARIEGQLSAQRSEAARLERDEKRLAMLLDELAKQIEAARKAAEAARRAEEARRAEQARLVAQARQVEEKRRQEEVNRAVEEARVATLAARQAEDEEREMAQARAKQAEQQAAQAKRAANEAARETRAAETTSRQTEHAASAPVSVGAGIQPGLRWPLTGQVMARFGTDRPEGGVWRGILIRATEGTSVHAVSAGTVVYSNWLRGFGNLMILDHGQEFLTVYAYNQSLFKQVGERVKAGEAISLAGNTGGQLDSALYFEIRHRGAPVDPAAYLSR
jgi:septal ring factor EnvC (AmiA/AmiB activator)